MHPPARLLARLPERRQKKFPIGVRMEDRFSLISAAHHMIDGPGIFDPESPCHAPTISYLRTQGNFICYKTRTTRQGPHFITQPGGEVLDRPRRVP